VHDTSAQLGYLQCHSRWFMLDRRQIKNTDDTQTKHNPEKSNTQNTANVFLILFSLIVERTKLPRYSVAFYDTRPENEVGFILQFSRNHTESNRGWYTCCTRVN